MNKYHGWIVLTKEPGYKDCIHVEWMEGEERRTKGMQSAAQAVEFFDKRAGQPVMMHETPVGAFRVYTEELPTKVELNPMAVRANAIRTECQRLIGILRTGMSEGSTPHMNSVEALCKLAEQLAELSK